MKSSLDPKLILLVLTDPFAQLQAVFGSSAISIDLFQFPEIVPLIYIEKPLYI